ncbi:MAG: LacI family transcriptional regulator [Spirochaetaceae bacterium]|jgi:LacI family transcriptional regulator|nr:LacI family transcriptional regulator [Spirochaetaceae bacterium]
MSRKIIKNDKKKSPPRNSAIKRITIKDIAAQAGVSLRTVSLVMNESGRISEATRKRVLEIAAAMNYRPNPIAQSLVNRRTYLFGVNFPYLDVSFNNTIIAGMERKCVELDYELLLSSNKFSSFSYMENDIPIMEKSLDRLVYRRVDGIVSVPDIRAIKSYREIIANDIPLLQILRNIPELPCPSILVNNERGMYLAVKYLLDRGLREIAFLHYGEAKFQEAADRYRGYLRAFQEQGIAADFDRLAVACDLTFRGGVDAARRLLQINPNLEAIVAATDYAALGVMRACVEAGKNIPKDISVIGFDDMDFALLQGHQTLSTVRQPKEQLGALAAEYLYRMVQGEKVPSLVLEPELVIRESSI